jgi:hypothetical protein
MHHVYHLHGHPDNSVHDPEAVPPRHVAAEQGALDPAANVGEFCKKPRAPLNLGEHRVRCIGVQGAQPVVLCGKARRDQRRSATPGEERRHRVRRRGVERLAVEHVQMRTLLGREGRRGVGFDVGADEVRQTLPVRRREARFGVVDQGTERGVHGSMIERKVDAD